MSVVYLNQQMHTFAKVGLVEITWNHVNTIWPSEHMRKQVFTGHNTQQMPYNMAKFLWIFHN